MKTKRCLLSIVSVLALVQLTLGVTYTVDGDGPADFSLIQDAINATVNGDTIIVNEGTYIGFGNRDLDFKGKAITVQSQSGPENCIIDCQGSENEQHRGFYFYSNEDTNSVLDGFTITNGVQSDGGGIYCISSPKIINCVIKNNSSIAQYGYGGGIHNSGNPIISHCYIIGNSSKYSGGGMALSGSPQITNCTISNNSSDRDGGGIYCYGDGNIVISNCEIIENTVVGMDHDDPAGAGIFCNNCNTTIMGSNISNNYSTAYSSRGGGIYLYGPQKNISIKNSSISSNSVEYPGGGIYCYKSSPTISNCIINGNKSLLQGGGVCCCGDTSFEPASPILFSCVLTGNCAKYDGGGIYCVRHAYPSIINCSFNMNNADQYGGAIYCVRDSEPILINTILWGDNANYRGDEIATKVIDGRPSEITVSYCDVENGDVGVYKEDDCLLNWGEGNIDANPRFCLLGYWDINETPDDPSDDLWIDGDYHLFAGSPCINNGDNSVIDVNDTDMEDNPRIIDEYVDMGPYEGPGVPLPQYELTVSVVSGGGSVNPVNGIYDEYEQVTVIAMPDRGYRVKKWSGTDNDLSTDTTNILTIDSNKTVSVEFEPIPVILTILAPKIHLVEPRGSSTYDFGSIVNITATPAPGYRVEGWYDENDVLLSSADTIEILMDSDKVITVAFLNSININRMLIKADKSRATSLDTINMSGSSFDATSADFSYSNAIYIDIHNKNKETPIFSDEIKVSAGKFNKGKYSYRSSTSGITSLKCDVNNNTFSIVAKSINLTSLKSPVIVEIEIGDYYGYGVGYDGEVLGSGENIDIINGKKSIPIQLLSGCENSLRIDKCTFKLGTMKPRTDRLMVQGAIAVEDTTVDLAEEDIVVTWGNYAITLPADDLNRLGSKKVFKYKKPKGANSSIAAAIFNLEKCTYKIIIQKADIGFQSNPVLFTIQFAEFNQSATVQLTAINSTNWRFP